MSTLDPGPPPTDELPFFVYGTLLPGEPNHDLFLRGRTSGERAAVLPRALLYDGPGYPYAIDGHGRVHGTLLTAAPGVYGELLGLLDHLEEYLGPGHPRNLYERVVREVELPGEGGAAEGEEGEPGEAEGEPGEEPPATRAWVYLAAAAVTRSLRTSGSVIAEGRWVTGRPPDGPRTP
ncbi:gamma-glutamylcyclotransferase family protein [Streptomyces cyaneofuscatus]|uniref:Gamma-glutamylcyclotransferase n=1 Tax=Streptomyces cyaneofuscatus TaxID=66883 RepID=A0ABZ1EU56_9ACTN|nr:gamma-glutamylcyclotransferase family protein [Streptomyces cyaneofuscatus]WSB07519.1 gamma-glutamylcyclotransferase [Streptomyces cyaneofuscatus]WSD48948.1 gamma-glutamylcyclotransferase [Streptomyces cyaneofuscatus]WTA92363.1 gamma-glutamylcyclotransferase [Streptomyces cyaneofuscatus]